MATHNFYMTCPQCGDPEAVGEERYMSHSLTACEFCGYYDCEWLTTEGLTPEWKRETRQGYGVACIVNDHGGRQVSQFFEPLTQDVLDWFDQVCQEVDVNERESFVRVIQDQTFAIIRGNETEPSIDDLVFVPIEHLPPVVEPVQDQDQVQVHAVTTDWTDLDEDLPF